LNAHRLTIDDENEINKFSIIEKIKNYYKQASLSSIEFIKILDPNVFQKDFANLKVVEKTMLKLKVISPDETSLFINDIKKFYGEEISVDSFIMILENQIPEINIEEEYPDLIILE